MADEKKVPEVDNAPPKEGSTVVAAAGVTSARGKGARGNLVEEAMVAAVNKASEEARAIWEEGGPDMTDAVRADKQKRIAAIMSPEAIFKRKMAARREATGRDRELNTQASKSETKPA
jgi:hypothetical protein